MTIQSSVQIGTVLRNARIFNPRVWLQGEMASDSLLQSVQGLFALLEERRVNYVLVGDIALLHYVEGRNTQDLDLIMALAALKKLPELQISSRERFFARAAYAGLQIDVLLTQNLLFKKVQHFYTQKVRFLDREVPIATVEGLLLLKLYALPSLYRQGNFARVGLYENDVATLLHDYRPALVPLLDELSHHLDEADLTETRAILAEIQTRLERFDRD
jgi:hypothetical protein